MGGAPIGFDPQPYDICRKPSKSHGKCQIASQHRQGSPPASHSAAPWNRWPAPEASAAAAAARVTKKSVCFFLGGGRYSGGCVSNITSFFFLQGGNTFARVGVCQTCFLFFAGGGGDPFAKVGVAHNSELLIFFGGGPLLPWFSLGEKHPCLFGGGGSLF